MTMTLPDRSTTKWTLAEARDTFPGWDLTELERGGIRAVRIEHEPNLSWYGIHRVLVSSDLGSLVSRLRRQEARRENYDRVLP